MIKDAELKYGVGALLYSPALNVTVAQSVIEGKFSRPYSLAICLEDSIADDSVAEAEKQLAETLQTIYNERNLRDIYCPKIFIRVRSAEQIIRIFDSIGKMQEIVCGFVIPKYTVTNADSYNEAIIEINGKAKRKMYMMPILESQNIVDFSTRRKVLLELKELIDSVYEYVLNIRVGGNDFSNVFAARRHYDETIYDILPIANLLSDILTVFSREYVVSGPVWEFFSSDNGEWKSGLKQELKLDKVCGFVGKTVIHPNQIPVVNEAFKVSVKDYEDAKSILNWDRKGFQVGKSSAGERMNEVKTHYNWAQKTLMLAKIYGITEKEG